MTETVPKGWEENKFYEIVDNNNSYPIGDGDHGIIKSVDYVSEGIPLIRVQDIKSGKLIEKKIVKITPEDHNKVKKSWLSPGDILITKTGTLGETCIIPANIETANISSSVAKITIDTSLILREYFIQFIQSKFFKKQLRHFYSKTSQPGFNNNEFEKFTVFYPKNILEQEKIADILSKTDEQIQLTEEIIAKTEELKKGLMQQLLTKGIGHTEFKEINIFARTYEIPRDWDLIEINKILELLTDFEANGSFADVKSNVNVTDEKSYAWYVRATDLENNSSLDKVKYVDEPSYNFLRKTKLFGKEVLITKRGEIGKVYQVPELNIPMTVAPNTYLLKLNNKVESSYLYYFLKSIYGQGELKAINRSTTIGAIYKDDVKYLMKIPLPSIEEQRKISQMFIKIDTSLNQERNELKKLNEIKIGLMQDLLSGKIRVGL
jgi:type I restriction enzyme, S subunit